MTISPTKIAAIIPARMASQRFPGKPLLQVAGLPMIEHVRRRVELCPELSDVVVASCDEEIAAVVRGAGGRIVMTAATHRVATERIVEAMAALDCTHVINVQGDELLILPKDLSTLCRAITAQPQIPAWNAIARLESDEELCDRSIVKCAVSRARRILFCSRQFAQIPSHESQYEPLYKVLGVLAYTRTFLQEFLTLPPTPLESLESIEQLRIVEHGIPLATVEYAKGYPGINLPAEVPIVEEYLRADPAQQTILKAILTRPV